MTDIILKRIIKEGENAKTPRVRIACGVWVSIIGIILSVLPIDLKYSISLLTHSESELLAEQITIRYLLASNSFFNESSRTTPDRSVWSLKTGTIRFGISSLFFLSFDGKR